jgi:hypothetical protein
VSTRSAPVVVTLADLQAAWLQRRRGDWPPTFDAVMADPMLGRLVRAEAIGRALALRRHLAKHSAPASRTAPAWLPPRQKAPVFDRKRAASGEREDD